jgi:signal transduction histidine kinase
MAFFCEPAFIVNSELTDGCIKVQNDDFFEAIVKFRFAAAWVVLVLALACLGALNVLHFAQTVKVVQSNYVAEQKAHRASEQVKLETSIQSIYENIRTLASLPSVRNIDRHAENLSEEARVTFQQLYNNLATNVAVSEVYIVPIDFNPNKFDPITLKPEEPILMFDQLILNPMSKSNSGVAYKIGDRYSGPPQIESFEYHQMANQVNWLSSNFANKDRIEKLQVPFISGPEVLTCDNSGFIKSLNDKDRQGVIFSVPFYNMQGQIKGMISAIILTNALERLLPDPSMALINPGNHYVSMGAEVRKLSSSQPNIETAEADPALIYSEAVALSVVDVRSPWYVWSGLPNERFENYASFVAARADYNNAWWVLGVLGLAAAICIYFAQINASQSAELNNTLAKELELSENAKREAHENAEKFETLHSQISTLNLELAHKIRQLTEAQDDIIKKGKLAQLGSLVATVAHELRNPLGGIRTTAFTLKRKLKDSPVDVDAQMTRIENGVARCDGIIAQLLDFSRTQPLTLSEVEMNAWLRKLVEDEVAKFDPSISVQCLLLDRDVLVSCDPERLRRSVNNLLSNAAESLMNEMHGTRSMRSAAREIIVAFTVKPTHYEISVADNGPGIPEDVLAKIGEPLFTTKSFGTGLGLAAVHKIMELHGGRMHVQSSLDSGATFTLQLPKNTLFSNAA